MRGFLIALQFLSRFPVTLSRVPSEKEMADSVYFFPLVGFVVGGAIALSHLLLSLYLPSMARGGALLAVYVFLTGGMHLDGLADTADGLLSPYDRQEVLSVMSDSRVGAMGVIALVTLLLMRYSLYASLLPAQAPFLVAAAVSSRWAMAFGMGLAPYAKGQGLGRVLVESSSKVRLVTTAALSLVLVYVLTGLWGFVVMGVSALVCGFFTRLLNRRIGGITGDTLGALNEIAEVASLLVPVVLGVVA